MTYSPKRPGPRPSSPRTQSRFVGGHVMTPADLRRLHKYMLEIEKVSAISDEMRMAVEELWPELAHKLPPKKPRG